MNTIQKNLGNLKILFLSNSLNKNKTGIQLFTENCLRIFSTLNVKFELLTFTLPTFFKFKFLLYIIWLNTYFYIKTHISKPDVIFCPDFLMPILKRKKTRYLTVIHDLSALRNKEIRLFHKFYNMLSIYSALKRADIIIAVSETIKLELLEKFNFNKNRIHIIYNTLGKYILNNDIKDSDFLKKYSLEKSKYILSVATVNKRKNIPELIKAFELISKDYPKIKLVLVGGLGNEQIKYLTKNKNVVFTDYVQDDILSFLYKNAFIYVFPSLYEGFGIPIIEAQYSNLPIICSEIPVFKEVAGDGAEYCAPIAEDIADKIGLLIKNPKRRNELIQAGFNNQKRFSTEVIKKQIERILLLPS